ncbi:MULTISPECIES: bifunctional sugar phosphate isomerase/epimerase/4-hydroxyphenylpyruvate dioxygenase family protein [unclassified Bradyrhizobium]|uniref:bifunctional sugar phosphate isomerase/epimerase/4-hydroxyphenylpyruvate dioxygenase family protein n=1 Tax=unclassified Bradyrhizobium TaxID=2631580 RepID=UPI001BAC2486|nr:MULTISPECIES: sugar phosphate isomerase/epimerase and 4-hydroxyphenylpyruvate domain-containing protein [unclassified Bradyrhizobium]MBR1225733.1 sugar phosphate isomerase/epimerase and 4-hydroxyphenylpyruvate domain-containing protein [Bradyrhizobium sp. AUGA SZCCT0176]MBR1234111.1 sugar phosphate isomerase/epimerase and 4-hydroxyphenylpyruvate domain-containing protein [Bradyrhizobium sp. AUGA SZCCT0182]MBR1268125.1 sugar phosphate isomerase/epimerase and 4-hydroxyphenylpyruvate domain-cont
MTKRSIATVSLSGSLDEKLRAIAGAGFDAVEIFENDLLTFNGSPRDVGQLCRDLGLSICAFQPFRDFEGMPEPQRARNFARAAHKFDLMQELGTDLLLICSNVSPASLGGIDRAAADFRALGELAASHGLRVGFEALAWGRHVNDYRDAWEIVRRADHKSIGVILDSFHALAPGFPVSAIQSIPADRIFLVQLADAPKLGLDVLSWSRHFRCFPGQGDLPVGAFMDAVAATGYSGPLSLEIFNDQFRSGSPVRTATDGLRSLILLEDELAKSSSRASTNRLQPKAQSRGVGFVEFAVDETKARNLSALLGQLGFRKTGSHRSKDVERWSQGHIELVINCEPDGFAHSHYVTHGPGVCAIAIDIDDAGKTMARAEALKAHTFYQPVGPGELEIPAIRGVGGSLLYFLEAAGKNWDTDFEALRSDAATDRLEVVDHISQSMPYDEMLSWLLFYTGILDLQRLPQMEIADPVGLVQSQALINGNQGLRVILNGSSATRTLSARFINEFFGSGVQHIAFSCSDIFTAVADMRSRGADFLKIPDNYYDDIEAKYDLDAATMTALRDNQILYDREGDGEFFQVYTHTFDDRFFFEIVQRRDYQGFGAANAAVRLAAQTRESRPLTIPRA